MRRMSRMPTRTTGWLSVLLSGLCCGHRRSLLLLMLLLSLCLLLLLLLLLLRLLGLSFAFFFGKFAVTFLSFTGQF